MNRTDGRALDQLRPVQIELGFVENPRCCDLAELRFTAFVR